MVESVTAAIESYQRPWMPAETALANVIVGIDPAGGGATTPEARAWDDLSLLTAGYLFHMVNRAGGKPMLSRSDERPPADTTSTGEHASARLFRDYGCHVYVSITYAADAAGPRVEVVPLVGDPAARSVCAALADGVAAAHQLPVATPAASQPAEPAAGTFFRFPPACAVRYGYRANDRAVQPPIGRLARENAALLYAGLARFCREHPALAEAPPKGKPATTTSPTSAPFVRNTNPSHKVRDVARSIWPEGRLPNERVDWFCQMFARLALTNRSLTYFDPSARVEDGVVVLSGATDMPLIIEGLEAALHAVGHERVRNTLRVLPDVERLDGKPFGACQVSMALTYVEPNEQTGQQTQLLYGEPVFLLDRDRGYYLLRAGDGYWGWVRADAIHPMTTTEYVAYTAHAQATAQTDIDLDAMRIPRAARVAIDGPAADGSLVIIRPDGARSAVPAATLRVETPAQQAAALARVRAALDLLYTPYVFGGRSPLGLDCSGLVQSVCTRAGGAPGRDAWHQAFAGALVATHWYREGLRAGDLVYFVDSAGKMYHAGVAIDSTHIVHSAPPGVQINSFVPGDPLYDQRLDRDFCVAKRP